MYDFITSNKFNKLMDRVFGLSAHISGIVGVFTGSVSPGLGVTLIISGYVIFTGESLLEYLQELRGGGTGV